MGSNELSDDEIDSLLQGDRDNSQEMASPSVGLEMEKEEFQAKKKVQKVSFGEMEENKDPGKDSPNLNLLMDVPLDVSVEIGRTKRSVQEVLSLNIGSVLELNKLSGEPVDLLVNGKVIAKAEVIIIDENFGIRITEIVKPKNRITFD